MTQKGDENAAAAGKNLYKWNRHDSKLKSKIKESNNIRECASFDLRCL